MKQVCDGEPVLQKKQDLLNNNNLFEIMLLTYNRCDMLQYALESLLNQTVKNFKITIVDNASNDGTEEYIRKILENYRNVNYYRQEQNLGLNNNIKKAIELATSKYVMLFHDDDILHPQYVEIILKLLNKNENVDIISCSKHVIERSNQINKNIYSSIDYKIFKNKLDYFSFIYINKWGEDLCYPSIVYKTENIKTVNIDEFKKYDKICDKPFALSTVKNNVCIFINQPLINYRTHDGQDTFAKNSISDTGIINHNKFFKDILQGNLLSETVFNIYSYYWIKSLNNWTGRSKKLNDMLDLVYKSNAISRYTYLYKYRLYKTVMLPINCVLKKILRFIVKSNAIRVQLTITNNKNGVK